MQGNTPAAIYAQAFDAYRQQDLHGALRFWARCSKPIQGMPMAGICVG